MKKKLSLIVLMTIHLGLTAQNTVERNCFDYDFSPDSKAMLKVGSPQPNLNTGTLNLNIPIYTWQDPDFQIPFTLSYSTNGFKPANQTGIVGLDWTLVVGGRITRQMNGLDDLKSHGRYFYGGSFPNSSVYNMSSSVFFDANANTEMIQYGSSYYETDPDLFRFQFLGYTGSFILNSNGEFIVFDSNGNRGTFSISYNNSSGSFMITTGNGFEYHFGSSVKNRETLYNTNSIHATYANSQRTALNDNNNIVIAWCLDKIVAPNGRELHFAYSAYNGTRYNIPQEFEFACTTFSQGLNRLIYIVGNDVEAYDASKLSSTVSVAYLDSLYIRDSAVSEINTIARLNYSLKPYKEVDSNDNSIYSQLVQKQKKLDSIQIMTSEGELIGGAEFNYTYRNTRMLLNSARIKNTGLYQMEYNTDGYMPGILTNALDFWGYYNGRTDLLDYNFIPTVLDATFHESINSNIKNPNDYYSILGTLKSITYPTGGKSEFEYEPNTAHRILLRQPTSPDTSSADSLGLGPITYLDPFIPTLRLYKYYSGLDICGGVRIKSITDYNGDKPFYKRTYSYNKNGSNESSGIILNFKKYYAQSMGNVTLLNPFITFTDNTLDKLYMAYSTVTEIHPDGSRYVYQFSDYLDYPDEYSPFKKLETSYTPEYEHYQGLYMNNVMREPNSRHYRRGKIKSIEKYSSNGTLLHKGEYEYADSDSSYVAYLTMSGKYIWSVKRFTCDRFLVKQTETIYDNGQISTVKRYEYNQLGQIRSMSNTDIQEANGKKIYFRYCHENPDYNGEFILKGAISDKIETRLVNNNQYVLASEKHLYDTNTKNINPITIIKYDIDSPILSAADDSINNLCYIGRSCNEYTYTYEYNPKLRIIKETAPGDRFVTYEWDNDNKHIISKTVNSPLQKYEYEWKEMVGPTKIKDPTNLFETYDYDSKGRLQAINDTFGNPIIRYEYNIKNE